MTDNVTHIATKTQKTQDWTPLQMLQHLVKEMEAGTIDEPDKIVLAYMYGEPDTNECRVGSYHARASGVQSLSMFEMVKHFIMRDMFGG